MYTECCKLYPDGWFTTVYAIIQKFKTIKPDCKKDEGLVQARVLALLHAEYKSINNSMYMNSRNSHKEYKKNLCLLED